MIYYFTLFQIEDLHVIYILYIIYVYSINLEEIKMKNSKLHVTNICLIRIEVIKSIL